MILLQFFNTTFNTCLNKYKLLGLFFFLINSQVFYVANTYAASDFQKATQDQAINILEEKKKLSVGIKDSDILDEGFTETDQSVAIESTEEEVDEFDSVYKIELLVFAYVNNGDENSEVWRNLNRPDFSEFKNGYAVTSNADDSKNPNSLPLQKNKPTFLKASDKGVGEFSEIIRKMKINGHYRPLKHLVWQQKVLDESAQDLFYVQGGNKYLNYDDALTLKNQKSGKAASQNNNQSGENQGESEMEGTIHIYRSRYLHIKPNLWLSEYTKNDAGLCLESDNNQTMDQTINSLNTNKSITSFTPLTNFRLDQHRRIRSGELHYLDHPRFGLLIKFTRVEKPVVKNSDPYNPD